MILLFKGVMFGCHVSFQNVTLISRQGMWERVPGTNVFKKNRCKQWPGHCSRHPQILQINIVINTNSEDVNTNSKIDTNQILCWILFVCFCYLASCFKRVQLSSHVSWTGMAKVSTTHGLGTESVWSVPDGRMFESTGGAIGETGLVLRNGLEDFMLEKRGTLGLQTAQSTCQWGREMCLNQNILPGDIKHFDGIAPDECQSRAIY